MDVSILGGTAGLGKGLAARLAIAGHRVFIGSRSAERAASTAQELRELTRRESILGDVNESVVRQSEIAIVTVPFIGIYYIAKILRENVRGDLVVVSAVVPLESELGGRAEYIELPSGSAAETLKELLDDLDVVSAFVNLPAEPLLNLSEELSYDVVVCGDEEPSRRVMELIESIPGLRALYGGRLRNSRITESLTALIMYLNRRYRSRRGGVKFVGIK